MSLKFTLSQRRILFGICWIILSIASIVPYYEQLNRICLYVLLPLAFLLSFIQSPRLKFNKYFFGLILLYTWISFTALFAYDTEVAIKELHKILGCIMITYIISNWAQHSKAIPWLYGVYVLLFLGAIYYAVTSILMGDFSVIGVERVNDETLNTNTIAYYTFYLTFLTYMLGEIIVHPLWHRIFRIGFWVTFPVIFIIAIATASMQVGALILPFAGLLLLARYWGTKENHKNWQRAIFVVLIIAVIAYILPFIVQSVSETQLGDRIDSGGSSEERMTLLQESISIGLSHLLVGVGPGNFRLFSTPQLFSHNTYTELFANTGLLGMLLFIWLQITFCWTQWRRWKAYRDPMYGLFLIFGLYFALYQFIYVFYADLWLMGFWILVTNHSSTYYIQKTR